MELLLVAGKLIFFQERKNVGSLFMSLTQGPHLVPFLLKIGSPFQNSWPLGPLLIGEQKAFDSLWQVYNFWVLE